MNKTKYIVFENTHLGPKDIIVFSELLQHIDVARAVKRVNHEIYPVSAGFIDVGSKDVYCYGESISLDLKSEPDRDAQIAKQRLFHSYE